MNKQLSWVPRRRGSTYCSPACGFGCTIAAYQHAKKSAADLTRRLGPGWHPDVWENIGWHYSASSPDRNIRVTPTRQKAYVAFLNGRCDFGLSPEDAVIAVIKQTEQELIRKNKILGEVQTIYHQMKNRGRK